jgi:hypothetical protein
METLQPIIQEAFLQATVPDRVNEVVLEELCYSSRWPQEE